MKNSCQNYHPDLVEMCFYNMSGVFYNCFTLAVSGLFLVVLPFLSRAEIVMEGTTAVFVLFLTGLALFVFRMWLNLNFIE